MTELSWFDKLLLPTNLAVIIPFWTLVGFLIALVTEYLADFLSDAMWPEYHQDLLGARKTSLWIIVFIGVGVAAVATIANYYSHFVNHGLIFKGPEIAGTVYAGMTFMLAYAATYISAPILREQIVDTYNWLKRKGN
jgi:hypothetical protein